MPRLYQYAAAALVGAAALLVTTTQAGFRDTKALFTKSKHVTTLTNENFEQTVVAATDQVWIVDFYSPWCPHCRHFAPELEKIAAFYANSKVVHVGAVDCTTEDGVCNSEAIEAYPSVKIFHVPPTATSSKKFTTFGAKNMKAVVKWVEDLLEEAQMAPGISQDDLDQQLEMIKNEHVVDELGLAQERSMRMKYARLQDAGAAALFTLENSLFIGKNVLEGERYEAAVAWIGALAASFPLETNRAVFQNLLQAVQQRDHWDAAAWTSLMTKWKAVAVTSTFPSTLLVANDEASWTHCNTYTCGLWTLFHAMSVQAGDPSCPLKPSNVAAAVRLFVMHFFGCEECVKHFLRANPKTVITEMSRHDTLGNKALVIWLWRMHSTVNKVTKKAFWPSVRACESCFTDNVQAPTLDPAKLQEDGIHAFVTDIYQYRDEDVWALNYESNGMRGVVMSSLGNFSWVMVSFVLVLLLLAGSQRKHLSSLSDALLKREHAA